jgi:Kef-type K+ transport system membrane component KefB
MPGVGARFRTLGLVLLALFLAPALARPLADEGGRAAARNLGAVPAHPGGAEEAAGPEHDNPVAPVLVGMLVMLVGAKLAGRAAERLGQPAVLGELLAGIALGNVALFGWHGLEFLATDAGLRVLAELGVILLLFEVGLESDLAEMKAVGWSSLLVACLGVVTPFLLGWGVSAWFLPEQQTLVHVFVGATLCATSVGITARVLADLGRLQDRESKIILGAAVLDDVLGLVVLAVVTGAIQATNQGADLDALSVGAIMGKALAFLLGAVLIGGWASRRLLRLAARLEVGGMLLVASLGFCLLLSWLANLMGLATIVGAFAAGLILDEVSFHDARQQQERSLADLLQPIATILVPIFFVRMGVEVDLRAFGRGEVLGFAALITVAAILGKLACAFGVLERGLDRLAVAVGMLPRGEVGLIFAGIGAQLLLHGERVIDTNVFSAVVVMVIATTVLAPPLLKLTVTGRRAAAKTT